MELIQVLVLAVVQGLTEFLPISSSAHLVLVPVWLRWSDQGLAFDVAVHLGTLVAVVSYFRVELRRMAGDWLRSCAGGQLTPESRLVWSVLFATLPVGLAGLFFGQAIERHLRSVLVVALATIGFALALWLFDRIGRRQRDEYTVGWREVAVIGCAQALALIPGASRSGVTITAGLLMGLTRTAAARFSFLLSIPVIVLAGALTTLELLHQSEPVDWLALGLGATLAALSAYLCIDLFLRWLDRFGMTPFVVYRIALGMVLLGVAL